MSSSDVGKKLLIPFFLVKKLEKTKQKQLHHLLTEKRKQKLNLRVENDVLFTGLTEDSSPGDRLSVSSEELLQGGKEGTRIHRNFCLKSQKTPT